MLKIKLVFLFIFSIAFLLLILSSPAYAQPNYMQSDIDLAQKYSPVLFFHPEEIFLPQPTEVLVSNARLRQDIKMWIDLNVLDSVTLQDLANFQQSSLFLDIWYGTTGESDSINYTAHRNFYLENLSPDKGGPPPTIYAIIIRDDINKKTVIQYWLFYYYNDWFNKHEGDWELIQIILDRYENPEWVVLSQHHGGTRRPWNDVKKEDTTHPVVYPALGSHANYFWGDEIYPNGKDLGNTRVEILDRTGSARETNPEVILISNIRDISTGLLEPIENGWLNFHGRWGESATYDDFGGPVGPVEKGLLWSDPYAWGIAQPIDTDTWYQNRFRLEMDILEELQFSIENFGNFDPDKFEGGNNFLIYHGEVPKKPSLKLAIDPFENPISEIQIYWPEQDKNTIDLYTYEISTSAPNRIILGINPNGELELTSNEKVLSVSNRTTNKATWDSPDLIWFAGYLPIEKIFAGVLISLFAGIAPGLLYLIIVYQVDYFEREPNSLLLATFLWGAMPAIAIALIVPLFFNLPPELLGPSAIEAIRTGIFAPLIEEAVKGAALVYISVRFRNEFDDTLDGIIYGAFVGLGFAITGNTISFIGAFLLRGFASFDTTVFVRGLLFGLDHAMYSAIFGAGLGYARLQRKKVQKHLLPLAAFFLAVFVNGAHSLILNGFSKFSVWAIIINWAGLFGIGLIISWAWRRQKQIIRIELKDELPAKCIEILASRINQRKVLKTTKKQIGRGARKTLDKQFQLLSELAFKKHQSKIKTLDNGENIIQDLRAQISGLNEKTKFY